MDANALGSIDEQLSINIAASFTADSLEVPLRFWMEELRLQARIQFAPYGQVFQQLLTFERTLSGDSNGIDVILVRLEDWGGAAADGGIAAFESEIERNVGDFLQCLRAAAEGAGATFIVCLCPPSWQRLADARENAFIAKTENYLSREAEGIAGVHVLHGRELVEIYRVPDYHDDYTDKLAHVPYTPVFFTALGTTIARKISALKRLPRKVIVLDCDYTLWSGACAENGPVGVQIDAGRKALQEFVLKQHDMGMVLCLCSKNDAEDVQAVFENHPDMLLKPEHILASRINWKRKSENLMSLAHELNLALDSFIFIDDDPVECGEVESNCPDALTIQLPHDTESLRRFLAHLWVFDHGKVTAEDKHRTTLYKENFQRDSVRQQSLTFAEFLAQLRLIIDISPLSPQSLERAADLTYRTNQFNLTTIRRSESELRRLLQEDKEVLVVNVQDRFGNYGLVGVIIFQVLQPSVKVDTFMLSCRAMGRGVEHQMLARLGAIAVDRKADDVELLLMPTSKNKPAADFLESLVGASKESSDGGLRYRVPARVAADCRLDSERATLQNQEGAETGAAKPTTRPVFVSEFGRQSKADFLITIATKLNDAVSIHEVISTAGRVRPEILTPFVAPSSPMEKEIAGLWTEMLGFEQIGINDSFFNLGGHSLLAMQILSRIRTRFNVQLSPRLLVTEEFTVAGLAKAILMEQIRQSDSSEVENILQKLDALSIDELKTLVGAADRK
jgi:FkbH-like protein